MPGVVVSTPEIFEIDLNEEIEFIILGSLVFFLFLYNYLWGGGGGGKIKFALGDGLFEKLLSNEIISKF